MLERFWLILILVLASIVPPMHAAQQSPLVAAGASCACAMTASGHNCSCDGCPCAGEQPADRPVDQDPAIPSPHREQQRASEPRYEFLELVFEEWSGPDRLEPSAIAPAPNSGAENIESLLCVWRI